MDPQDVFLALVNGICEERWDELPNLYAADTDVVHPLDPHRGPALRTRDDLREHFRPTGTGPTIKRRPANIVVHHTADPEVIVAEFEYHGTVVETGEDFVQPAVLVLRVRDGQIVSSRDYLDHLTSARIRGRLGDLLPQT